MSDDGFFGEAAEPAGAEEHNTEDAGAELVVAMLQDAEILRTVHEMGLHPKLLGNEQLEEGFQEILTHYAKFNEPITYDRFTRRYPHITLPDEYRSQTQDLILDVVLAAKQRHIAGFRINLDALIDPQTGGNYHREENLQQIYEMARDLLKQQALWFTAATDRIQTFGDGSDVKKRYEDAKAGIVHGIRLPGNMGVGRNLFEHLGDDIGPLTYGSLTGLFSRPGVKKTWTLILLAAWVAYTGKNVFIWSSEMETPEMKERAVAMLAGLNFTRYVRGQLTDEELKRFRAFLDSKFRVLLNEHMFFAGPTAIKTAEDLEIYCSDNQIQLACLDNVHTMEAKGEEHVKIHNLMFDLKYLAIRRRLPIVFTTHQNRYGSGMEGVAYGDAFNTWSSNMINMKKVDERTIQINTIKVRNGIGNRLYRWIIDLDKAEFKSSRMQQVSTEVVAPRQATALNEGL